LASGPAIDEETVGYGGHVHGFVIRPMAPINRPQLLTRLVSTHHELQQKGVVFEPDRMSHNINPIRGPLIGNSSQKSFTMADPNITSLSISDWDGLQRHDIVGDDDADYSKINCRCTCQIGMVMSIFSRRDQRKSTMKETTSKQLQMAGVWMHTGTCFQERLRRFGGC